jgi:two-component system LytT family response regulator
MINSLIIDDEQHCIDALVADLGKNCNNVKILGTCDSAKEGILSIRKLKPQLVFLDVEMPWMNGFEMLEVLPEINFRIIFTTAYDKFAAKAFRISAIDYLLKPVDAADLIAAVHKAEEKIISDLGINNSILYCTAEGAYTKVVLKDKMPLLISRTLGDIEEMLPSEIFLRIHHSTIVNLNAITHYSRTDGGYVIISTKEKLVVSKARKEALLQHLGL